MNVLLDVYIDDNFGDDLFVKIVCERYPNDTFYIIDHNYNEARRRRFRKIPNLKFVAAIAEMCNSTLFDMLLLVGGDMFPNTSDYRYRELLIDKRKEQGKPVSFIGCNLHKHYDEPNAEIVLRLFEKADFAGVRDEWTYNFIKTKWPQANVRQTADLAFSYRYPVRRASKPGLLGISIRRKAGVSESVYGAYCNSLAFVINAYLSKDNGNTVRLYCFSSGSFNDKEVAEDILQGVTEKTRVSIVGYDGDIDVFLGSFAECEYVIATRFHAIIMALVLNIPMLPYAYESKVTNLLHDIGYSGIVQDYGGLTASLDAVLQQIEEQRPLYDERKLAEYTKRADVNFLYLDKFCSHEPTMISGAPLVSIVLPVYNGKQYVAEAIESCLSQNYKNIELIVVDDCSTDNTIEIVEAIAKRDSRLKIVKHTVNKKLPGALNTGFSIAKGELFTWISDDNKLYYNALAEMVHFLQQNPQADLTYADYVEIDEHGTITAVQKLDNCTDNILIRNIVGACFLYKKEVHERLAGYDETAFLIEDYDFWLRAYLNFKFEKINKVLYEYRIHGNSLSATKNKQVMEKRIELIYKILPEIRNVKREILYKAFIALADDAYWVFRNRAQYIDILTTALLICPDKMFRADRKSGERSVWAP
ncbi:MAG: putative glycosyltransferase [Sphingobacterium sp.]|nr:putative glycosyltransferase [Sphingobacterium sp.]